MKRIFPCLLSISCCLLLAACAAGTRHDEDDAATRLPTGQFITPLAASGAVFQALNPDLPDFPAYRVGQAMSEALSPDGDTLVILTSGYNRLSDKAGKQIDADSNEYLFFYDVRTVTPKRIQVLQVPDTFAGLAFAPDGKRLYVSGGGDDTVHVYAEDAGRWQESGAAIALGHKQSNDIGSGPAVAGVAVTADGRRLVAANYYYDSVSLVDTASGRVTGELDLRPGKSGGTPGTPGGENPFWVVTVGSAFAYVSSQRDREVDVLDVSGPAPRLVTRIPVAGTPGKMLLDAVRARLYVACDNSDSVAVIDVLTNQALAPIPVLAPSGTVGRGYAYRGAAPNSLALSSDGKRLYVTDGGTNAVAVVALDQKQPVVLGLIPTGWYPQAVVAGVKTPMLYVVNSRSNPGPNPSWGRTEQNRRLRSGTNQYILQLEKAGFLTLPVPSYVQLTTLTQQVMANDGFGVAPTAADQALMAALHQKIKHVIYIVRENRSYDQVLGDLPRGNGDPALTEFGHAITPNLHAAALEFATLDNFYVSGEVSGEGWPWSTAARESDQGVKTVPLAYGNRGIADDTFGLNRGVNVALPTLAERQAANPDTPDDPDLLPGTGDVAGVDGPGGQVQQGYLWSAALRAGLTVRNYGMEADGARYDPKDPHAIPLDRDPYAHHLVVTYPAFADLVGITDPYYRAFDPAYPEFYREREWEREFRGFVQDGKLPTLSLLCMPGDHMGSFDSALDGVNTPELQQADGDYAVGRVIQAVAESPYAKDTLIFILEDDAQDGPDHVDAHRSTAYVVGPYVKHAALVSDYYTTVNVLRTIEDVLGIDHLSLFDANTRPMTSVFDLAQADWSFQAKPSALLANTQLPIPGILKPGEAAPKPTHDAAYWTKQTADMDFSSQDRVDAVGFNRIVWQGLMTSPYPEERSGEDLRERRPAPDGGGR